MAKAKSTATKTKPSKPSFFEEIDAGQDYLEVYAREMARGCLVVVGKSPIFIPGAKIKTNADGSKELV